MRGLGRRAFIGALGAGGIAATAGCVSNIQARLANKTAQDAADELQEQFEAQPWLVTMETEVRGNDDIVLTMVVDSLPDEETVLRSYADLIAGGYECNNLQGTIRFDIFGIHFTVERTWAEQFNAGSISYATYEDNVISTTSHWVEA